MTILQEIIEYKKEVVAGQKQFCSVQDLEEQIKYLPAVKSFSKALKSFNETGKAAIIAEVKKASPSKGVIREDFDHIEIARTYEELGVAAISVLTDEKYFQGKIEYLKDIKEFATCPVLRKDFIIDEYQVYQTRAVGADIILLIAAALDKKQLEDYYGLSKELGLEVLLEVHDEKEFDDALDVGAEIIGINNRNLKTFEVNLQTTVDLIKSRDLTDKFVISESGIREASDIKYLQDRGVTGFLIGETLLRKKNIGVTFANLIK